MLHHESSVRANQTADLVVLQSWKKRWFVLRNEKLAYYKDHKVSTAVSSQYTTTLTLLPLI